MAAPCCAHAFNACAARGLWHVSSPPFFFPPRAQVVRQVHEFYADYLAVNHDLFHLGMPRSLHSISATGGKSSIFQDNLGGAGGGDHLEQQQHERNVQGVLSALLSLKMKPSAIRYSGTSPAAKHVATAVGGAVTQNDLFDSGAKNKGTSGTCRAVPCPVFMSCLSCAPSLCVCASYSACTT